MLYCIILLPDVNNVNKNKLKLKTGEDGVVSLKSTEKH